jgi:splicing factor 3B subunit 2
MLPQMDVAVEVEYVPEKADVDGSLLEDFKSVFEKFSIKDTAPISEEEAQEEVSEAAKKSFDSDSDEEEQDGQQKKEGAVSNKKKKVIKISLLAFKTLGWVASGLFLMSKFSSFFCS